VAAIAPGKLHRLRNCSTAAGRFVILAADHRNSLRRALMPEAPNRVDYATHAGPKAGLVQALSPARGVRELGWACELAVRTSVA
jgi:tagatose-1,6-bisphosphate aldolase